MLYLLYKKVKLVKNVSQNIGRKNLFDFLKLGLSGKFNKNVYIYILLVKSSPFLSRMQDPF